MKQFLIDVLKLGATVVVVAGVVYAALLLATILWRISNKIF